MIKNLLCISATLIFATSITSQVLYSNTFSGGSNNAGTIGKYDGGSKQFTTLRSLGGSGVAPVSGLTQANDGKLYGLGATSGVDNFGGIFSIDPVSGTYTDVASLSNLNGRCPTGSLLQANDGKLYGMTNGGTYDNPGILFSFDPVTSTTTKLLDFSYSLGIHPYGNLMQGIDGKLYGMTFSGGGAHNPGGVLFSYDIPTGTYSDLVNLANDFGFPKGNVIQTPDGKFYGMTSPGIASTARIFVYDPFANDVESVHDFNQGEDADGNLTLAPNGKLYGLVNDGGTQNEGFIFSFDPSSSSFSKVADFNNSTGAYPGGALMLGNDGKMYGLTGRGGNNENGTVFSYDPVSNNLQKVIDLSSALGSFPTGSLLQASSGEIFGITSGEGRQNQANVFSLNLVTKNIGLIKTFSANQSAINPSASLVRNTDGKFYGISTYGGAGQGGIIYSYDNRTNAYTEVKHLDFEHGDNSYGSLVSWDDKKLYGTTAFGGIYYDLYDNEGTLFSFDPASGIYSRLFTFNSYIGSTGSYPYGSLLPANDKKLYGLTSWGGDGYRGGGTGVIFSFDPTTSTYNRLFDFGDLPFDFSPVDDSNGTFPYGSLIQASNGKLYGMTSEGGTNHLGVIFSYDLASGTYSKLVEFDGTNGSHPYGSLAQGRDKKLYGMTYGGGGNDAGVIFSYDLTKALFTKLYEFDFANGSHPYGNVMQASDGKLYGMTNGGGANDYGVAFSFDSESSTFTKLVDYDQSNGANPYFGSAFVELPELAPLPVSLLEFTGSSLGEVNKLVWKVVHDNLSLCELQRSVDGLTFNPIGDIQADQRSIYHYDDDVHSVAGNKFFYRLKVVDIDGNYKFSNVVKLEVSKKDLIVSVGPNPSHAQTTATIQSLYNQPATLRIASLDGHMLFRNDVQLISGNNVFQLKQFEMMPSGTYLLEVSTSSNRRVVKVVKAN